MYGAFSLFIRTELEQLRCNGEKKALLPHHNFPNLRVFRQHDQTTANTAIVPTLKLKLNYTMACLYEPSDNVREGLNSTTSGLERQPSQVVWLPLGGRQKERGRGFLKVVQISRL